jgi:hypothetical protein
LKQLCGGHELTKLCEPLSGFYALDQDLLRFCQANLLVTL